MGVAERVSDPLLGGFYTASEAARLLRLNSKQRIYRWLGTDKSAVVLRDYEPVGGSQELSFWDLFEVRFVERFRAQGLSLQYLRAVAIKARTEFKTRHPFALYNAKFVTDRKRIFQQAAEEMGEKKRTHELISGQCEMYEVIEATLAKGVEFNPETFLAEGWPPLGEYPNVTINPRFAYGQPAIGALKIPTAAIFRFLRAEGNKRRVADWYGVTVDEVEEAAEFEVRLAA